MYRGYIAAVLTLLVTLLTGCATNPMRQYDSELKETVNLVKTGAVKQAIEQVEKNNTAGALSQDKDILYYFEKGELLSLDKDYAGSRDTWLKADAIIQQWEDEYRTNPQKLIGDIGSYLINDKTRRYDGQDYEKVMLSAQLTLDHILLGSADLARIEMKKTYEREQLIKSFREKEYDKLKEEGDKLKVDNDPKHLKDYPLAELDTPEVRDLKNGYQNAFAHYLAGYFFEVTGEPSLAEPGYRNALQLSPNKLLIQGSLKNVGRRKPGPRESDVLFVVESGFAPSWKSITIPIPVPRKNGLVVTALSFPVLKAENRGFVPPVLTVAGRQLPVETLSNIDTMARRLLKDQMPSIILRTVIRAALKAVAEEQANQASPILGIAVGVASVATEQADDRSWRTLPERISVARAILPHGRQTVEFQTGAGAYRTEVNIGSRFTIVPIRLTGGAVYVGQPNVAIDGAQSTSTKSDARPPTRGVRGKPANAAATQ
ncbi:MAG: hypothetical protein ABTS16_15005 [Candidatus Accumulibacter phosphatis]|jgi:hypothetical protein|uniref:TPR domain protein n=1 Tax=Candidatus Accumulibacter contiguus TaxID=2954381 RepID=A0ABX1T788_9PROT|nr:hypothetical protein [Candidatus Accumulibacter contiguus]NMQ04831.1 hypothetical protein [Candidatus Accumulibacter contiguus]